MIAVGAFYKGLRRQPLRKRQKTAIERRCDIRTACRQRSLNRVCPANRILGGRKNDQGHSLSKDSVIKPIVAVRVTGKGRSTELRTPGRSVKTEATFARTRPDELLKFGLVVSVVVSTDGIVLLSLELVDFIEADKLRLSASVTMEIVKRHSGANVDSESSFAMLTNRVVRVTHCLIPPVPVIPPKPCLCFSDQNLWGQVP